MKFNTFVKYKFQSDIYVRREANDLNGTVEYQFLKTMDVNIVSGKGQTYMYTPENIEYGARLVNVLNPRGEQLFLVQTEAGPQAIQMYVHASDPVVDFYGNIIGYRQVLRRNEPSTSSTRPNAGI